MLQSVVWFLIRCAVTLVACFTLYRVVLGEGYHVDFRDLLIIASVTIVTLRFWMPICDEDHNRTVLTKQRSPRPPSSSKPN